MHGCGAAKQYLGLACRSYAALTRRERVAMSCCAFVKKKLITYLILSSSVIPRARSSSSSYSSAAAVALSTHSFPEPPTPPLPLPPSPSECCNAWQNKGAQAAFGQCEGGGLKDREGGQIRERRRHDDDADVIDDAFSSISLKSQAAVLAFPRMEGHSSLNFWTCFAPSSINCDSVASGGGKNSVSKSQDHNS
eukprot:4085158-Pyramimonas_sp.AAC.1